jgi:RHS repeat-associated protein
MSGADIGGMLAKAAQNAGGLEQSNQQMGDRASPFDVWSHSFDGLSNRLQSAASDPVGTLADLQRDKYRTLRAALIDPRYSSSLAEVGDSIAAQAAGLGDMVDAIGEADGALATVGATFALLTGIEQMLSTLVSVIPFPALPAIRVLDMDVGLPHAHSHPPNLIPPAPPVPFPSTGPIVPIPILSGASRTLINGMPAARCGDMGLGIWCGGYFPLYEVFLGSSSVWIEGSRAGRLAVDITKHCIFTAPKPTDPPLGPMIGVTVMGSGNVMIGGVPMPSLLSLAIAGLMKGLMKGLGKVGRAVERATRAARQRLGRNLKPGFLRCKVLRAEPVDVVTGEVVVDQQDFIIPGRIPIEWTRHYGSHGHRAGVCGHGWQTQADARLVFEDAGSVIFHDGSAALTFFPSAPMRSPVVEQVDGAILERTVDGWVVRTKQGLRYLFPAGSDALREIHVDTVQDAFGNWLRYVRDHHGLRRIEESAGRAVEIESAGGLVRRMQLRSADGSAVHSLVSFDYDESANLIAAYDALGVPYRFAYADHMLIRHTDRNGLSFHYEYDLPAPAARCVHAWGDGGLYEYRFSFDDAERCTTVVDSLGNSSLVRYDHLLQIVQEIDALGGITAYEYDAAGRTTARVDAAGRRTEWVYRADGCLTQEVQSDGGSIVNEYDAHGQLTATTDTSGATWRFRSESYRMRERTSPRGAAWRLEYTPQGDLHTEVDPYGNRTRWHYDTFGNVVAVQEPTGPTQRFQFDVSGRPVSVVNPDGSVVGYGYDPNRRLHVVQLPSGTAVRLSYDHEGNLTGFLDQNGRWTQFAYRGLGQLAQRTDPDGSVTRFERDTEEQLIAVVNQRGERYEVVRDPLGRIVRESDYSGAAVDYALDAAGNPVEVRDAVGRLIRIEYDMQNRMTHRIWPDGGIERFEYDAGGNLILAALDDRAVRREYDEEGNLIMEEQGDFVVRNSYDLLGRRIRRETGLNNVLRISYDGDGRTTEIELSGRSIMRATYGLQGRITEARLGAALARTYTWNPDGRLVHQQLRGPTVLADRQFRYDPAGNLIARIDSAKGTLTFTTDVLDRVVRQTGPGDDAIELEYDVAGNLLHARPRGFDDDVRTVQYHDRRYDFDRTGNAIRRVTRRGTATFEWTAANRLAGAVNEQGQRATYMYDALGRRVSKEVDGRTTFFYWDDCNLLAEVAGDGSAVREYVFAEGTFVPLAWLADEVFHIETDHVGLPHEVVDERGECVWSATYGPGGEVFSIVGDVNACNLRLQGQYHDAETGLSYNLHRYCDPLAVTFLSADPLGLTADVNLYQSPANVWRWSDPLGLACRILDPATGKWRTLQHLSLDEAKSMYRVGIEQGMTPDAARRWVIEVNEEAGRHTPLPNPNQAGNVRAAPGHRPTGRASKGQGMDPDSLWKRRRGW